jgi:hypothetical protein
MGDSEKKVIQEWPQDRPNAVDPLERFSFERCLADPAYAKEHEEWFRAAAQERKRRVIVEAVKGRRAEQEKQAIFSQLEREAADRQKRQAAMSEKQREKDEAWDKRRARLVAGTRPWNLDEGGE